MFRLFVLSFVASVALVGCSSIEERQERAYKFLDKVATRLEEWKANRESANVNVSLTGATQKVQSTTSGIQRRFKNFRDGVKKVGSAVEQFKEGTAQVKGSLNVSGENGKTEEVEQ